MSYDLMDDIANKTLAGISKAQKDYEDWTGGYWLWEAPEYMITTISPGKYQLLIGHSILLWKTMSETASKMRAEAR